MIVATPILQIKTSPIPITYTVYKPGLLRVVDSQTSSYDISMSSSEIPLREIHLHYMFPRQREYTCFLVRKSWRAEASIYVVYVRMRVVVRFWRAGGSARGPSETSTPRAHAPTQHGGMLRLRDRCGYARRPAKPSTVSFCLYIPQKG